MNRPHVGDVGTRVEYRFVKTSDGLPVDLTGVTVLVLRFQKPSGEDVEYTQGTTPAVTIVLPATDGKVQVITPGPPSLWTAAGGWRVQGYAETTVWKGWGEVKLFSVGRRI